MKTAWYNREKHHYYNSSNGVSANGCLPFYMNLQ